MLHGLSHPTPKRRSAIVESHRSSSSSRCRVVWAFAADRCFGRNCGSRQGGHCSQPVRLFAFGESWMKELACSDLGLTNSSIKWRLNSAVLDTGAVTATADFQASSSTSAADGPADPDAVLDSFVSAFGLPRQQLRMVLERQPALQRANPQILAQRIEAYTRTTGLDAYQLLYMAARLPTLLRLSPPVLKERCEALAKGLALGVADVLRMLVSQPAFLEIQPDMLRAVSGRVAGELGIKPGAALRVLARMPPSELRGIFTRQQPGLMRERLGGLRRLLLKTFGPRRGTQEVALLLVARCPTLLALPSKFVEASLAALMSIPPTKGAVVASLQAPIPRSGSASGFGAAATAAGTPNAAASGSGRLRGRSSMFRAILSCPHVLTLPPETLRGRFVMLAAAARIDIPAVVSMLLLQPRLLLADPARVRQRLEGLTFSLMMPRSAALDMVVRQPQLLLYNTETLAENWTGLQRLLGITFDSALSIVTRHPNILCTSQAKLASKLNALEAIFSIPRPRAVLLTVEKPVILTMSEQSFQNAFRVLAPLLALPSPAHLGRLVCKEPYLLLESTVQLTAKVSLAASLLGISENEVGAMMARSPHFITKELSYWQTNMDTVMGGLDVSLERAREVVVRYPYLMAAEPKALLRVASANMGLVRSSPAWLSVLARADADSLFKCLAGFNDRSREHLQYLVDANLQSEVSFLHSSVWDRTDFVKRFPRFADWQVAKHTTMVSRNGLPLPRRPPIWPIAVPGGSDGSLQEFDASPADETWGVETSPESKSLIGNLYPSGSAVNVGEFQEADALASDSLKQPELPVATTGWLEMGVGMEVVTGEARSFSSGRPLGQTRKSIPRRRKVRRIPSLSSADDEPQRQ